jgi:hypothetical protein
MSVRSLPERRSRFKQKTDGTRADTAVPTGIPAAVRFDRLGAGLIRATEAGKLQLSPR